MKNSFLTRKMGDSGTFLVYKKGSMAKEVQHFMMENDIDGMTVHDAGDPIFDLGIRISEYTFLKKLHIMTENDQDWSFISHFDHLVDLFINTSGSNPIDLSSLLELETLVLQWRPQVSGIGSLEKLQKLGLLEFREKNLEKLTLPSSLQTFIIKTSAIQTLNGLQHLQNLRYLELANCRTLRTIGDIDGLPRLNRIHLDSCPKIEDYDRLVNLPMLDCLIMMDCKDIPSINFLRNFHKLSYLAMTGSTNIVDGNLDPLKEIKEAHVAKRKHYKP